MQNVLKIRCRYVLCAALIIGVLSACGGGSNSCSILGAALGSGVSSSCNTANTNDPAPVAPLANQVDLYGSFGKGLLAYAQVQAYELIDGKLVLLGSKTSTATDGSYILRGLRATNNPVVVELSTTDTTTMLDETLPLVNGRFQIAANAPVPGTKMRTAALSLQYSTVLAGSPLTEMAVSAAQSSGTFNAESLSAGKAMLQQMVGFDPFTTAVVDANAAMSANQQKLMVLMTAMMQDAKTRSCSADKSGLVCLITELNKQSAMAKSTDNAYYLMAGSMVLNTLQSKVAALSSSSLQPSPFLTLTKQQIPVVQASMAASVQGITSASISERQKINNFIELMRSGFNQSTQLMNDRMNNLKIRTDKILLDNVGDGLSVINDYINECAYSDGILNCNPNSKIFSKATGTDYGFKYQVSATGALSGSAEPVFLMAGTISSKWNSADGTGTLVFNSTKNRVSDSKRVNDILIKFSINSLNTNSKYASIVIDSISIKSYDINSSFAKWGQLELTSVKLEATKNTPSGLIAYKISGAVNFQSSEGDRISGSLTQLNAEEKYISTGADKSKNIFATNLSLSLEVVATDGPIMSLGVTATQDINKYTPSLPSTINNSENFNIYCNIKEAGQSSLAITSLKSKFDQTNNHIKFENNAGWIDLTYATNRKDSLSPQESVTGDIMLGTSGPYTARIFQNSRGQFQGDIFNGEKLIGAIIDNILIIAGVQVSLN